MKGFYLILSPRIQVWFVCIEHTQCEASFPGFISISLDSTVWSPDNFHTKIFAAHKEQRKKGENDCTILKGIECLDKGALFIVYPIVYSWDKRAPNTVLQGKIILLQHSKWWDLPTWRIATQDWKEGKVKSIEQTIGRKKMGVTKLHSYAFGRCERGHYRISMCKDSAKAIWIHMYSSLRDGRNDIMRAPVSRS